MPNATQPQPTRRRVSRRRILQGGAVALAGLTGGVPSPDPVAAGVPEFSTLRQRPRWQGTRPPNVLVLMVDEQRYPAVYESATLAAFRQQYLTTQELLRQTGIEFRRHYAASVACEPSRASIYTGHYPSLHGVTQTSGAAKRESDPGMFFLDPNGVPTFGDYFLQAGYQTHWRGKWHVSRGDLIVPGTHDGLESYNLLGQRDPAREALYQNADRLEDFGFSGWIGREPHGADPRDSGGSAGIYKPTGQKLSSRDTAYAAQTIELLQKLDQQPAGSKPWLIMASFVNPHDIALWGLFSRLINLTTQSFTFDFTIGPEVPAYEDLFIPELFARTHTEDLSVKPRAQESYRDTYARWMQPVLSNQYYRFYYQLHRLADQELGRVYAALKQTRFFEDTIVVFTSDHGDLLGSHGGMYQKWYTAYEEALHVPLIVSNPRLATRGRTVDIVSSHIDLVPTLLGLIGADANAIRQTLSASHSEAQPLVGRDLSGVVLGNVDPASVESPIYFMTDDDPSRGLDQKNFLGFRESFVVQPNHLDTVIARIDGQLWKYTEYFDNAQFWSDPNTQDVASRLIGGTPSDPGTYTRPTEITVKNQPVQPQPRDVELYRLSTPAETMELTNLAQDPAYSATKSAMANLLAQQRTKKRLTPQTLNNDGNALTSAPTPVVPELPSALLFGSGLVALGGLAYRQRNGKE
jgi:choline-sulfatase